MADRGRHDPEDKRKLKILYLFKFFEILEGTPWGGVAPGL